MPIRFLNTVNLTVTSSLLKTNSSGLVVAAVAGTDYLTSITSSMVTTALGYTPVPTTRTLTINGTTFDLSANRSWTVTSTEVDTLATVTGRGATTSLAITTGGLTADFVNLKTSPTVSPIQGSIFWSSDDSAALMQVKSDLSIKLGQDNTWYVKNQTGSTIAKGTPVMATGTVGASGRITVAPMVANGTVDPKYLLGVTLEAIADGQDGFVINIGKIKKLNTSAFTAGAVLYCDPSTPGGFTASAPASPNLKLPIAFVVNSSVNEGVIAVRVNPGSDLHEDSRVQIVSTLATGQLLRYNSNRWENWTPNFLTTEADTLATVTGRGATTSTALTLNGNVSIGTSAKLAFGSQVRQMIDLWASSYGIGVQSDTQYFRTGGGFAWFRGGVHSNSANDPGAGGSVAMRIDSSSNLTVTGNITASNFSGSSSGTNTGDQTTISGNAGSATVLQTARNINGTSFNGSADITTANWGTARTITIGSTGKSVNGSAAVSWTLAEIGAYAATNPSGYITASDSITGTSAGVLRTVTGTNSAELVRGNMGDNDQARILVGATASNAGFLEIATADDGTEPIHVRQYTGVFTTLVRTATLLDGSGNTSFPGTVTAPTFSGALSGNASTATSAATWTTARNLTIGNTAKSVNGSANVAWSLAEIGAYAATNPSGYTSNTGTVTSVAMTVPTGLAVSGSPVTTSGTLALSFASGYSIPTTTKQGQWDTAYGWGNHANYGYWNTDLNDPRDVQSSLVRFQFDVEVVGTFTESSSIRFKENIVALEPTLEKVTGMKPVTYNKIGSETTEVGLIAEEVAELFPDVVTYNDEGQPQGIQYQRLSVILLKAVQELTERVNKLENK